MIPKKTINNRWPKDNFKHLALRTFAHLWRWLLFEVMLAIIMPFFLVGLQIFTASNSVPIERIISPKDIFLLSAGLLCARISDVLDIAHARRAIATLTAFYVFAILIGILLGTALDTMEILSRIPLRTANLWPMSLIYALAAVFLISLTWALEAADEAPKNLNESPTVTAHSGAGNKTHWVKADPDWVIPRPGWLTADPEWIKNFKPQGKPNKVKVRATESKRPNASGPG